MILIVIFLTGIVAGFVDAIAGGGGMIMIPGLIFSGLPVATAIATNKLCGTCGVLTSFFKFAQAKQVDWQAYIYMGVPAVNMKLAKTTEHLRCSQSKALDTLQCVWWLGLFISLCVAILFTSFEKNKNREKRIRCCRYDTSTSTYRCKYVEE